LPPTREEVEREFGRLKHEYGLSPLRVRGLARVQLHADLTMLARLSQAPSREREPYRLAAWVLVEYRQGRTGAMVVAASTVAVVAIAAAIIAVAFVALYVLPRGGRRKRPPRT
jgi:hypothetical protein